MHSKTHVSLLKLASFIFIILMLLVVIGSVLVEEYLTMSLAIFIFCTGLLSLSDKSKMVLLHCCSLVLLMVYGIVYVFIDGTRRFKHLSANYKVHYIMISVCAVIGFLFTVGTLTIFTGYYYKALVKAERKNCNYV